MDPMVRIMVLDHTESFLCEIDPTQVMDMVSTEEINGAHTLNITTLQPLEKTNRLLVQDSMGTWHEYVVLGMDEDHEDGGVLVHEYYCVWSLQYDLMGTFVNNQFGAGVVPGHESVPTSPRVAMEVATEGTARWSVGTVSVTQYSSASFYRRSGWEALQTVTENWGGEIGVTITVDEDGVATRAVDLLEHTGSQEAVRRFDYGFDLKKIKRTISDDIWPCRIVPLGKSVETEAGGYTRRPGIESANGGIPWLEYAPAVPLTRVPDGAGGWEYPTLIVKTDAVQKPAEIKAWGQAHIAEYCQPIVTYEAELAQFVRAGFNPHGVALGDEVAIVDNTFGEEGLRLSARVVKVKQSLLNASDVKLTIGTPKQTLGGQMNSMSREISRVSEQQDGASDFQSSVAYMAALLDRLNEEINATGGYAYITSGSGILTYDVAVSDPLVGSEASRVVEIKGGSIRIADSRTQSGDWDWRTLIVSGHIAADLITAINVTAGYIGSTDGLHSWDLDTGTFESYNSDGNLLLRFDSTGSYFGGEVRAKSTYYASSSYGRKPTTLYWGAETYDASNAFKLGLGARSSHPQEIPVLHATAQKWSSSSATDLEDLMLVPCPVDNSPISIISWSGINQHSTVASTGRLGLVGMYGQSNYTKMVLSDTAAYLLAGDTSSAYESIFSTTRIDLSQSSSFTRQLRQYGASNFYGNLTVGSSYTKSKSAQTDDYGERLLYCYETPTPMFGDVGSGTLDGDGCCYVSVDPVFAQTVRGAYQVFLQACGRGELWVEEKRPDYFVVRGEPGMAFDWEMKAAQRDVPNLRLDEVTQRDLQETETLEAAQAFDMGVYDEETNYADRLEAALREE